MKILPVKNSYNISYNGRLSPKTCLMIGDIQTGITNSFKQPINKDTKFVLSTSKFDITNKLANIFDNLNTIMERFGHGCELTFEQSEKSSRQRFYINNKSSYYKMVIADTEMPLTGCPEDIAGLEHVADNLEKINPYEANLKFITHKISHADEKEFIPDENYMFLEDRLIKI